MVILSSRHWQQQVADPIMKRYSPRSKHTTMRSACPLCIGNSTAGSTLKMVAWLRGGGGAVTNWTADPSVFPHGMAYIQNLIRKPTVMHNRQWSDKSDYIKNLDFEWYKSKYAVPKDPVAFFDWFFQQQKGWGLSMYEQDWMCTEYDGVDALNNNVTMGDLWLKGMASGAGSGRSAILHAVPESRSLRCIFLGSYKRSGDWRLLSCTTPVGCGCHIAVLLGHRNSSVQGWILSSPIPRLEGKRLVPN